MRAWYATSLSGFISVLVASWLAVHENAGAVFAAIFALACFIFSGLTEE